MPNSRASKDVIYRAKGLLKYVAGKLKGAKKRYDEAYKRGEDRPGVRKAKEVLDEGGNF